MRQYTPVGTWVSAIPIRKGAKDFAENAAQELSNNVQHASHTEHRPFIYET